MSVSAVPTSARVPLATLVALALLATAITIPSAVEAKGPPEPVRFATFNASLNRDAAGEALADLSSPGNDQASAVAEIIQRVRPEVLLINEFDFVEPDAGDLADGNPFDGNPMTDAFQGNYLSIAQHTDVDPIDYPYVFVAPSNTGIPSGFDLDNNGSVGGPNDAHGFGLFPGQFALAVFSRYPIDYEAARTFQLFKWVDMPGALLPDDPPRQSRPTGTPTRS